jgi:predicted metal-dependent hydrolase
VVMVETYQVPYGDKVIQFTLERKNVKNVNLNIKPDMTVYVSAHEKVPLEFIFDFVKTKASWISKHVGYFKEVQPEVQSAREYVSGESFKYLGKQYRLKVEENNPERVLYYRGCIYLYVKDKYDFTRKESLFKGWMRERANLVFHDSLAKLYPLIQKYNIPKPNLSIRTMKARWGSCLVDSNTILLNLELIKAPKYCIDYVVLHECIHFIHKNHDESFYNFQSVLMPDWKQRKAILDEEIGRVL